MPFALGLFWALPVGFRRRFLVSWLGFVPGPLASPLSRRAMSSIEGFAWQGKWISLEWADCSSYSGHQAMLATPAGPCVAFFMPTLRFHVGGNPVAENLHVRIVAERVSCPDGVPVLHIRITSDSTSRPWDVQVELSDETHEDEVLELAVLPALRSVISRVPTSNQERSRSRDRDGAGP